MMRCFAAASFDACSAIVTRDPNGRGSMESSELEELIILLENGRATATRAGRGCCSTEELLARDDKVLRRPRLRHTSHSGNLQRSKSGEATGKANQFRDRRSGGSRRETCGNKFYTPILNWTLELLKLSIEVL
jgi:hypothetical protein